MSEAYGRLSVIGEALPRHNGEEQALMVCSCGRPALRTLSYLRTVQAGTSSACSACLASDRTSRDSARRLLAKSVYLELWEKSGTLYGLLWEDRFRQAVLGDLEDGLGPMDEHLATVSADSSYEDSQPAGHGQYIHPISLPKGWECDFCKKKASDDLGGLGCVCCMVAMCHDCSDSHSVHGLTLEQAGSFFEVSRERVRQVEAKAIRKLRHPSRSKFLAPFFNVSIPSPPPEDYPKEL